MTRWFVLGVWLLSGAAVAQTPCVLANYGPNDGGWIGPVTRVVCTCSDCPMVRLEVRLATGVYGGAGSFDLSAPNVSTPFFGAYTHLGDYRWRATPLQSDGGALPTSVEGAARADSQAPTAPVLQQVTIDGGFFSLVFTPSTDDGIGVDDYKGRIASADEPTIVAFGAGTGGSPLASFLGPGDWMVGLYAKDAVDNLSPLVWWPTAIHTTASAAVQPPAAPVLLGPRYTDTGNLAVRLDATGEEFQFRVERVDGGVHVIFPVMVSQGASTIAYGFTPLEGEFLVRACQRVGSEVSDWSAGTPVAVDHTNPSAPGTLSGMQVGADVVLSWGAASDNIGVGSYVLERGDGVTSSGIIGLTTTDVGPAPGSYDYQVTAVDLAGHRGAPSNTVTVVVVAVDAGVADGGVDAGSVADAGPTTGPYAVGCSCAELTPVGLLALVLLWMRRARPA